VYVLVRGEAVFVVTDRERLVAVARSSVVARSYGDTGSGRAEREADLAVVGADVVAALLAVADPSRMIAEGCGVDEVRGSVSAELCDQHGGSPSGLPEFTMLFPACGCGRPGCVRCDLFGLTPRTAALLYVSAQALGDAGYDDVVEHGDDPVAAAGEWMLFDQFPPITFGCDAVWRRQAARAFDDLADDLAAGRLPEPRCPAEEMALRLTLSSAEAMLLDLRDYVEDLVAGMPAQSGDYDWALAFESLLQDDDMAALFNAEQDGIEDPDAEGNRQIGMGDYRPMAWFDWFDDAEPRDGRRPFRR
jgi:hypothetical protein